MVEAGLSGYNLVAWIGLSAPAGTPPDVVNKLSGALNKNLAQPRVTSFLLQLGMEYVPNSPKEFGIFVNEQLRVWTDKVRDAGIQPE